VLFSQNKAYMIDLQAFQTLYMSRDAISQKPINHWLLNIFYLLITYLLTY